MTAMTNDYTTIGGVLDAMYASISFEPGQRPDWSVHHAIFEPRARMVRVTDGGIFEFDNESYIRNIEAMIDDGSFPSFHEVERWRTIWRFGNIAHVTSAYRSFSHRGGPEIDGGINSIQMLERDGRWFISAMLWRREGAALRVPDRAASLVTE
jgi:hypothetical protein